jgi:cell division protein FtsX
LYAKAERGEILNFTGVSDPYEEPLNAEVIVDTDPETVAESVAKILRTLEVLGHLQPITDDEYSPEEEAKIKERLHALGYM